MKGFQIVRCAALGAMAVAATFSHAQSLPIVRPALGEISGTVFDSLSMRPVAGALVWVAGQNQSTVTDSAGVFRLTAVPDTTLFLAFSAPFLDSIGLGTPMRQTVLQCNPSSANF